MKRQESRGWQSEAHHEVAAPGYTRGPTWSSCVPLDDLPGLPDVRFASRGPLLIGAWSRAATTAGLELMTKHEAALVARHGKVSVLTVLVGAAGTPDVGLREKALDMQKQFDRSLVGTAIAVTAKGFGAVVIRTFLAGFSLVSSGKAPMKTFGTVPEAVAWLRALPGQAKALADDAGLAGEVAAFLEASPPATKVG